MISIDISNVWGDISLSDLLAIEAEKQNADICDYVVKMENPQKAAREIMSSLQLQ